MEMKKKILTGAVGLVALIGLGAGAANAATPPPAPASHSAPASIDKPTPGDTPDTAGTADTPTPGDTPDTAGTPDTPTPGDTPDAPDPAGAQVSGPGAQQTGDHTDPADAPGTP